MKTTELNRHTKGFRLAWYEREWCDKVLNDGLPPCEWLDRIQERRNEAQRRIELEAVK